MASAHYVKPRHNQAVPCRPHYSCKDTPHLLVVLDHLTFIEIFIVIVDSRLNYVETRCTIAFRATTTKEV